MWLLQSNICSAQSKPVATGNLSRKLLSFNKKHYQETIFLHLNSSFFVVGESILFKAYCLNSFNSQPSDLSKIIYVELIDGNANSVLQTKISVNDGAGFGDIYLPSSLTSGNYTLITYTNWMRNFTHDNFYRAQLTIINPFKKPVNTPGDKNEASIIQFLPEGGKLISGVPNSIRFKVVNQRLGKVSGKIVDESGKEVVEFRSTSKGLGTFDIQPVAGKEYKVIVIDTLQNIYFQQLPLSVEGVLIQTKDLEKVFRIQLTGLSPDHGATILVNQRSKPIIEAKVEFKDGNASLDIKKDSLPFGTLQILVFSNDNHLLCESRLFNPLVADRSSGLSLAKKNFHRREKVSLELTNKDSLPVNLSLSVRKIETKTDGLCSYPVAPIEATAAQLETINADLLLFRPKWSATLEKKIIDGDSVVMQYLPEVRGNVLSGVVTKIKTSNPATGKMVYLSLPAKEYHFAASTTDSSGRFYFITDKIKSNAEIVIQPDSRMCADCKITLDGIGLEDYSNFKPSELDIDTTFKKLIEQRSLASQVENAYYEQKQDSIIERSTTTRFYGQADKTYRLDDYTRFPSMEDIFIEYIYEVVLKKKKNEYEIKVMDLRKRQPFTEDALVLIDGIPIRDYSLVMSYNPLQVEKIEIVGKRYFYGSLETQGIVSIVTYDGSGKNLSSIKREKYLGVQPRKKYYSPRYQDPPSGLNKIPDYRIQLYWDPSITVSDKQAVINFFTSDLSGDFEIIAEGIRKDGRAIYHREIIHVE